MATSSSKENLLSKARTLLADINSRKAKGNIFGDSKQAAETLCCSIQLLQSLQSSFVKETIPLDPSSSDWKTLKALLELLIRLGISPHLNPGVGIVRDKHQDDSSRISVHLSELSISDPLSPSSSDTPHTGMSLLYLCAEVLASFFWTTSSPSPSPSTYISELVKVTHTPDTEASDTTDRNDHGKSRFSTEPSLDAAINVSSPCDMTRPFMGTNSPNEAQFMTICSITHLVLKYFLWDLMAAYLQLGCSPCPTNENFRDRATFRLKHMLEHFPVEQMVVASFVLLNRDSPIPPPWIKVELGKQLSKLVMREGGLVIILEELVGRVTKGSIESYNKVAGHLAKVPKSVASTDEYLKAISPQVLPLLGLKHKPKDLMLEKISFAALNNVFHTSLSLTCKLFVIEPKLATKYLVQPMMKPLLALSLIQKSTDTVENLSPRPAGADHSEWLTEDEVVDSSVQLGVLLTAGCQGSLEAREAILCEARGVAPLFLKLHFQLASREYSSPIGNTKNASSVQKNWALEGKDVRKGFLNKGLGSNGPDEQAYEDESNLSKLKSSLADVVMAVVNQPVESALPCVLPFLLERTMDMVRWPQEEGEIWDTLQSKGFQSKSKVMYLSRLLLMVENWPLVVALLGKLLHKILSVPWSWLKGGGTEFPEAAELLRHMQDFEELNTEVGMKALEHDTCGAASLVKTVLEDELVLHDEDILELVLHMVYSVLKGIRTTGGDDSQTSSAHGTILNDLQSSLRKVYGNAHVGEKLRQMSFTLAKEVSALCNTSF